MRVLSGLPLILGLLGCSGTGDDPAVSDAAIDPGVDARPLPPTGTFRQTCDGSGGIALDATHFMNLDDEDQGIRIYTRGSDGGPLQALDISAQLGVAMNGEVDLEDLAQRGSRLYMIGSHGRNTSGTLKPDRSRFAGFDLTGTAPNAQLTLVGTAYQKLLVDLLDATNWQTPNAAVIAALEASSKLGTTTDPQLAPEIAGTNIEGLAALPQSLAIGFRNPQPDGKALVVTLTNPDAVLGGAKAVFGTAVLLDLGGLAIRGMAWSEEHGKVLVIAGPHDAVSQFRLYTWSGVATDPAVLVAPIPAPTQGTPEAVVPYPGSRDVQILYDQGDATIGAGICKDAARTAKMFHDVFIHVD